MRISDGSSDVCSSDLLARVRDRSANRIVADFKFSGEGETWDRLMLLGLSGGGKTLVRRDYGEGAAAEPMRYTRCAACAAMLMTGRSRHEPPLDRNRRPLAAAPPRCATTARPSHTPAPHT